MTPYDRTTAPWTPSRGDRRFLKQAHIADPIEAVMDYRFDGLLEKYSTDLGRMTDSRNFYRERCRLLYVLQAAVWALVAVVIARCL